jgi:nitrite reductase/ring-hydroxylating ferredoxin subunit
MNARGLRRFVGDLLRGRRPRPFAVEDSEDLAALRAAITLAAARPGADAPRSEFVAELHRKLAEDANPVVPLAARATGPTRRRVLITGSVAAGAAAIGAGLDHVLTSRQNGSGVVSAAPTLEPNVGTWRGIGASADLAQGGVQRFDLGSVVGFVTRDAGGVQAVSGICTHLGCRLNLDNATRQLDCPCHNTSFAVTGALLHYQLAKPPAPLPHIEVREQDGQIEVYVPV